MAVVDNYLAAHQLSTGFTKNAGINKKKISDTISHHREIDISLAPAIPPQLQQAYVDKAIQQIERQYLNTGKIVLEVIKL